MDKTIIVVLCKLLSDYNIKKINYNDITIHYKIGEGGQAKVYCGEYLKNYVAIKIIREVDIKCLVHELAIMSKLEHYCIPKFYGIIIEDNIVAYVTDFIKGNTMNLLNISEFSLNLKLKIIKNVIDFLEYLHSNNCVHRDLKPENIIIDENHNVFLIDFGISKVLINSENILTRLKGTVNYLAPESLDYFEVNEDNQLITVVTPEVDIWAFGCLVSLIFSGHVPWTPRYKDNPAIIKKLLLSKIEFPIPINITNTEIIKVIKMSTEINPKKRASINEISIIIKNLIIN